MRLLAEHSYSKIDHSDIIAISGEARRAKALNNDVINATIGMLFGEDESFYTFRCVKAAESTIKDIDRYAYTNTKGVQPFLDGVLNWVLQDNIKLYQANNIKFDIVSTPGGSGAIANTFCNYLNPNETVLLPSYMWSNYKQVAYENFLNYDTYELFDEAGKFNVTSFKDKCLSYKQKQGRVVVIINDPCHNPTGYSMDYEEWQQVVAIINEISSDGTPFILLHDLAYIDYDKRGIETTRKNMSLYATLNPSALAILAFSGSKTLGLYGLRIGAMIAISKDASAIEDFSNANQFSCRTKFSMSSTLGMNIIGKIFTNEELTISFKEELEEVRQMLIQRSNIFVEEAKKIGLKYLPFTCGFFVTIPCEKDVEVYQYLKQKGVYICPVGKALRVAICSVSVEHAKALPALIKEAMDNVK